MDAKKVCESEDAKSESDDDLEQVAAIQRKIKTPVITSVKDAHGDNTQAAQTLVTGRLNQGNEQESLCLRTNGKENRKTKRAK
ncbi:hypothetical protein F443_02678 [Phytophthora nicotianae P1569]|uniref:Uncharacterized protein n=1 Tax=Phytophthora nicotianae P1569 TaxID=1317065 RepID=V9FSR4_PHYNI|nr:hypothetical protein F443_02678 [Phytophthora nicotianae P1569]